MSDENGVPAARFELVWLTGSSADPTDRRLGLVKHSDPEAHAHPETPPLVVDFLTPRLRARVSRSRLRSEMLIRALDLDGQQLSNNSQPVVWDTTAGLGTDCFLIAAAGADVIAFEREPFLVSLVQDAFDRVNRHGALLLNARLVNMSFPTDRLGLQSLVERFGAPDRIYFDPMFAAAATRSKSLPKKGIQVLRELTQSESIEGLKGRLGDLVRSLSSLLPNNRVHIIVKQPMISKSSASNIFSEVSAAGSPIGHLVSLRQVKGKLVQFDILVLRPRSDSNARAR